MVWLSGLLCSAAHALDWLELLNPHIVLDPRELSRYQFMGRQWGGGTRMARSYGEPASDSPGNLGTVCTVRCIYSCHYSTRETNPIRPMEFY